MSYRHLDAPGFRVADESNLLHKSEALQLQRASSRMSWNAAPYSAIGGRENKPVNYVPFLDSLRFANWLHNGQPTGAQDNTTTENGAFTITLPSWESMWLWLLSHQGRCGL
jgi:hypothetical protein